MFRWITKCDIGNCPLREFGSEEPTLRNGPSKFGRHLQAGTSNLPASHVHAVDFEGATKFIFPTEKSVKGWTTST